MKPLMSRKVDLQKLAAIAAKIGPLPSGPLAARGSHVHTWSKNTIFPGMSPSEEKPEGLPPVHWFPKCLRCGTQIAPYMKGYLYRPDSGSPWTTDEPLCHLR